MEREIIFMKKNAISILNVVFCLLVIFIHICSEPVSMLTKGSFSHITTFSLWKLSSFVVQGFIFLGGLKVFLSKKKVSFLSYLKNRVTKIVLPYILAVLVYYVYFIQREYFDFQWNELFGYILKGDLSAHFYFVVAVFQFYLLKCVWEQMLKIVPVILGIMIAFVITAMGILTLGKVFGTYNDRIFTTYLIYWVMGCYIGKNYDKVRDWIISNRRWILLMYPVVAFFEVYTAYMGVIPYYLAEILHICYCLCAIFFCWTLAEMVPDGICASSIFKNINASSFYIYLWHILVLTEVDNRMNIAGITSLGTRFLLRGALVYILSTVLCGAYVKLKGKIRG